MASVAVLGLSPTFLREFSLEFKLCLFSCKLSKLGCVYQCKTRILCSHVTSHPHEIHFSGLMSDRLGFLMLRKQTHIAKRSCHATLLSLQCTHNVKTCPCFTSSLIQFIELRCCSKIGKIDFIYK